jgi:hypothetical protein
MALNFVNLDDKTRKYMVEELENAKKEGNIYYSKRFILDRDERWPSLLIEAARSYTEHWLAYQIEANSMMKGMETARKPSGGYTTKHVPNTAAETLAEGQFNRYYMLGVCRCALQEGVKAVQIYRAKEVDNPRPESERLIGQKLDVETLISEIRPMDSSLGHPLLKPNSGLSVKL